MGTAVCQAVEAAEGMTVAQTVDHGDDLASLVEAGVEVAVDFTRPDVVMDNLKWLIDHDIHSVVGTSGFDAARLRQVEQWLRDKPELGSVIAPNFGIGAVLMMQFAAKAAKFFDSAEVIEAHHPRKVDAPSGTAVHTARLMAQSREEAGLGPGPDATQQQLEGARGANVDGIAVHAIRAEGYIASQQVWFGSAGENFTISHNSVDRMSFMPGVVLSIRKVPAVRGLTVGIDAFLD
ncbi:4-hydroxy-tetrahydrodipicolinate reductase [Natronoglycomyces albus]|uniref:4-hydroxy-tetrahydrodipicolinate reductase n=2 Tax=Natronoglycomyces albus TaxID=2811108 RepID=A0A895XPG8_9ACTN|nr:4-hydroxy-tetrahydrodipicolinate reductase [Natronoglycomyces albus]